MEDGLGLNLTEPGNLSRWEEHQCTLSHVKFQGRLAQGDAEEVETSVGIRSFTVRKLWIQTLVLLPICCLISVNICSSLCFGFLVCQMGTRTGPAFGWDDHVRSCMWNA